MHKADREKNGNGKRQIRRCVLRRGMQKVLAVTLAVLVASASLNLTQSVVQAEDSPYVTVSLNWVGSMPQQPVELTLLHNGAYSNSKQVDVQTLTSNVTFPLDAKTFDGDYDNYTVSVDGAYVLNTSSSVDEAGQKKTIALTLCQLAQVNATVTWYPAGTALSEKVTFEVYADGQYLEGKDLSLSELTTAVPWTASVPDYLPLYKADGTKIEYTFKEKPIQGFHTGDVKVNSYEGTADYGPGLSIRVSNVREDLLEKAKDIPVSVSWTDENPEGRTASVALIADGEATGETLTFTAASERETFRGKKQFQEDGTEVDYTVEASSEGYSAWVSETDDGGFAVTFLPEDCLYIPVSVEWYVSRNFTDYSVVLYADGEEVERKSFTSSEEAEFYFDKDGKGYPQRKDGKDIVYSVEVYTGTGERIRDANYASGYDPSQKHPAGDVAQRYLLYRSGDAVQGFDVGITELASVTVYKDWYHEYSGEEPPIERISRGGAAALRISAVALKSTHPESLEASFQIYPSDGDYQEGLDNCRFLQGSVPYEGYGQVGSATDCILPIYDETGSLIVYTIDEVDCTEGYSAGEIEPFDLDMCSLEEFREVYVTNVENFTFTLTKKWTASVRDSQAVFKIYRVDPSDEAERGDTSDGKVSIFDLPRMIVVDSEEDLPELAEADQGYDWVEYKTVTIGTGSRKFVITDCLNTMAGDHTSVDMSGFPDVTDKEGCVHVTVRMDWKDGSHANSSRPSSATVQLYANGEPYQNPVQITGEQWLYTWTDLPAEDDNGEAVLYTVRQLNAPENYTVYIDGGYDADVTAQIDLPIFAPENGATWSYAICELPVEGYTTSYETIVDEESHTTGAVYTNTKEEESYTEISVQKVWKNEGGLTLPESVTVQLYQNAQPYGDPVELKDGSQWSYTWHHLPKMNEDGTDAVYTVKETNVPEGFEAAAEVVSAGTDSLSFKITNTSEKPEKPNEKGEKKTQTPVKTGDETSLPTYLLLMTAAVLAALILRVKRKKDEHETTFL